MTDQGKTLPLRREVPPVETLSVQELMEKRLGIVQTQNLDVGREQSRLLNPLGQKIEAGVPR